VYLFLLHVTYKHLPFCTNISIINIKNFICCKNRKILLYNDKKYPFTAKEIKPAEKKTENNFFVA